MKIKPLLLQGDVPCRHLRAVAGWLDPVVLLGLAGGSLANGEIGGLKNVPRRF